jgi:Spy/CpxP family protein refolding chaperone
VDSVTLVVTAVALGASAGLTETASSAVKDAYAGLKGLLNHRQIDVSAIERGPDSTVQRQALREMLAAVPDVVDQDLLDAAEQVTDVVAADQPDAAVRGRATCGFASVPGLWNRQ